MRSENQEVVEVEGHIEHETERAYLFRFLAAGSEWKKVWVPKSQVTDEDIGEGRTSTLWIKAWFATKEGMV